VGGISDQLHRDPAVDLNALTGCNSIRQCRVAVPAILCADATQPRHQHLARYRVAAGAGRIAAAVAFRLPSSFSPLVR
jgi:hypothetical protein